MVVCQHTGQLHGWSVVTVEGPGIHTLVSVHCRKGTDIDWRYTEKGERVRVSVRTGRIIPIPEEAAEHDDFVLPKTYIGTYSKTQFIFCLCGIEMKIAVRFLL